VLVGVIAAVPVALAHDPVVSLTVVAPDGTALANATVKLINVTGGEFSNTTDSTGVVDITVPATGLYYVLVYGDGYYILSVLDVTGDISATVNASIMPALIIQSTELSVDVDVVRSEISNVSVKFSTNTTIYTDSNSNVTITFPAEILKFPYKYTFEKAVYDTTEVTENELSLVVTANTTITAYYAKTLYFVLPTWALLALGVTVAVAIGIVYFATRAAKHVIVSLRDQYARFVKRKEFVERKDEW